MSSAIAPFAASASAYENGASVNVGAKSTPPLIAASRYGQVDLMGFTLDIGADVEAKDCDGHTALLEAAASTYRRSPVSLLLKEGANVEVTAWRGRRPVHEAARIGNADTLYELTAYGADINASDVTGATALHNAACEGDLDTIECLVDLGADINAKNRHGETPLHCAALISYPDNAVELLLSLGADPRPKTNGGLTPYDLAVHEGIEPCVALRNQEPEPVILNLQRIFVPESHENYAFSCRFG